MKDWPKPKRYLQIFLQFSTAAANVNIGQFYPVLYPVHVFMVEALVRVPGTDIVRGVIQDGDHVRAAVLSAGHSLGRSFPDT